MRKMNLKRIKRNNCDIEPFFIHPCSGSELVGKLDETRAHHQSSQVSEELLEVCEKLKKALKHEVTPINLDKKTC